MMQKIYNYFKEKGQKGQSIIEYGLLIAVIAGAIALVANDGGIGSAFNGVFGKVSENVEHSVPDAVSQHDAIRDGSATTGGEG